MFSCVAKDQHTNSSPSSWFPPGKKKTWKMPNVNEASHFMTSTTSSNTLGMQFAKERHHFLRNLPWPPANCEEFPQFGSHIPWNPDYGEKWSISHNAKACVIPLYWLVEKGIPRSCADYV